MSTHISGLKLDPTDNRTDDELLAELAEEMRNWLLDTRAKEIGSSLHQHALTALFGYKHSKTPSQVIEEWHEEAASRSGSTYGTVEAVLHHDESTDARYLSFFGPGDFFRKTRDCGRYGTDFSYHNSSNSQLGDMTETEWHHRRDTWDELIPTGIPSRHGRALVVSIDRNDPLTPAFTDPSAINEARRMAVADHLLDAPFDMDRMMQELRLRLTAARRVVEAHQHLFGNPTSEDPAGGVTDATVFVLREATAIEYGSVKKEAEVG
ncbi:hypothetical protein LG293_17020 (plasmid) [Citricoccus nitrophenolicus]